MSTITIPQPELTTEDVSTALRKGSDPVVRCCRACGHRCCRGDPTPAGPTPSWWAPAPGASSGSSSRSTTVAAGPASGWRRAACRRSGLVNAIVITPRVRRTLRTTFGRLSQGAGRAGAAAQVVTLGRGVFASLTSRSTGRGLLQAGPDGLDEEPRAVVVHVLPDVADHVAERDAALRVAEA